MAGFYDDPEFGPTQVFDFEDQYYPWGRYQVIYTSGLYQFYIDSVSSSGCGVISLDKNAAAAQCTPQ